MKKLGFYLRLLAILWLFGLVLINFGAPWLSADSFLDGESEPPDPMAVKPLAEIAEEARPRGARSAEAERWLKRSGGKDGWGAQGADADDAGWGPEESGWGEE